MEKSFQDLQREEQKRIQAERQPLLCDYSGNTGGNQEQCARHYKAILLTMTNTPVRPNFQQYPLFFCVISVFSYSEKNASGERLWGAISQKVRKKFFSCYNGAKN